MISKRNLLIIGVVFTAFTGTVSVVFDGQNPTDVETDTTNINNANNINDDINNDDTERGGELASNDSNAPTTSTVTPTPTPEPEAADNTSAQSNSINYRYGVSLERGFTKETYVTLGNNRMEIDQEATEIEPRPLNGSTIQTTIRNELDFEQTLNISVEFQQPDDTPITSMNDTVTVGPGESVTIKYDYNADTDEMTVTEIN